MFVRSKVEVASIVSDPSTLAKAPSGWIVTRVPAPLSVRPFWFSRAVVSCAPPETVVLSTLPASIVLSIKACAIGELQAVGPAAAIEQQLVDAQGRLAIGGHRQRVVAGKPVDRQRGARRCQFAGVGGLPHRSGVFIDVDLRPHALHMIRVMARRAGDRDKLWRCRLGWTR